jgi:hypothetical protein
VKRPDIQAHRFWPTVDMGNGRNKKRDRNQAPKTEQRPAQKAPHEPTPGAGSARGAEMAGTAGTSNQHPQSQNERKNPAPMGDNSHLEFLKKEHQNVRTQKILAVLGAIAIVVSYLQWDASNKQYQVMIQQNKIALAQQCPWMALDADPVDRPRDGKPWLFKFEFENTGQSGADVIDVLYFKPNVPIAGVGS